MHKHMQPLIDEIKSGLHNMYARKKSTEITLMLKKI